MKSTAQKIKQCAGLIGTKDVTPWEDTFLSDMERNLGAFGPAHLFTEKQMDVLDRIYAKHFA